MPCAAGLGAGQWLVWRHGATERKCGRPARWQVSDDAARLAIGKSNELVNRRRRTRGWGPVCGLWVECRGGLCVCLVAQSV